MIRDWLWDRKISLSQAKSILKNPLHPRFIEYAALLLLRKNSPKEVFDEYLSPLVFCQNWGKIKKRLQKDAWGAPRLFFWQAVYEKVIEKLKEKGEVPKLSPLPKAEEFCLKVGKKIKALRKERGLTQKALAKKLHVSQQVVSRIESGRQNISLLTLKNIAASLQAKINFIFE